MYESSIKSLPLLGRGKVRDIYAVGDDKLLIVTTDRLSAFDVVLPTPIPEKGRVLTEMANFWFAKFASMVPNQLTGIDPETVVKPEEREQVRGRSIVVKKLKPLPIEAVVRGYLEGGGLKEYNETGTVCGIKLPAGLKRASKLPEPIFTPATKAEAGIHDENISFETMIKIVGEARAKEVREIAIKLYKAAAEYALTKGIIIADTKFEFGLDDAGKLHIIDEALTPDSSRFWPAATWKEGEVPESFDKQYIRNWLDSIGFERKPPAPPVPEDVARRTSEKYQEAMSRLVA
ncbi:Phosphoribosylaminoimidazole-succinocarboxamide synthase [Usitatibacter rugosus]|uniref:Phosphoribosylaminoimidazole-succinocarboxamide synthase n=1 Tax=Usitatibacter rugosus TaxID=2732067 RepID=A0A6M4H1T7_9PROT|nr:phosphoribosylaminoimidazolesuccinocarboxamide synthase [Usitatibacter rugosus]QJR12663.1 Phosphoribosylaminoimidazole-succinocarboxamide synthase [Usitatibacter rugosus]